jgi:toxin FitB
MILVDANVVSEPLKSTPEPRVLDWLRRQPAGSLYLSTISFAYMMSGVEAMPAGVRRETLSEQTRSIVDRLFEDRILPFDLAAARAFGLAKARAREQGLDIALGDAQIAAIALAVNASVATRYPAPFLAAGVVTINPWMD